MIRRVSWWCAVVCGLLTIHYATIGSWGWVVYSVAWGLFNLACAKRG